jgi:hypothetical protein
LAIAAIVVVALFVLVFGPARAVRNASSGETQLVPRKLASFCFAFNPCPVTCCGNVKSHIVKPSCHSLHESLMQNSLTLAMVAVVTVVGFAVVFGLVHAADAARGKPQVALSPATASSCLASHPPQGGMASRRGRMGQDMSTQDAVESITTELQAKMQSQPELAGLILQAIRCGHFEDAPVPVCTAIPYFRLGRPNFWSK